MMLIKFLFLRNDRCCSNNIFGLTVGFYKHADMQFIAEGIQIVTATTINILMNFVLYETLTMQSDRSACRHYLNTTQCIRYSEYVAIVH